MNARSTTMAQPAQTAEKWYIVDASGQIVGRVAAKVAALLRGKTQVNFTPNVDHKIHVIVTNADKAVFTGDKLVTKTYKWHTRYRTGLKEESARHLLERKPDEVLRRAIHGMIPHTRLGDSMRRHLRIYASGEYSGQHAAQKPEPISIATRRSLPND